MIKTFTNKEMDRLVNIMVKLRNERGMLGYAIMRNSRLLRETATEFMNKKAELVQKHIDEIDPSTDTFILPIDEYMETLGDIMDIEHDVDVFQIDIKDFVSGSLDASQMDDLFWMVKDAAADADS